MRLLIVRLQLTWLTFAAVVAAAMVTALGPRGGGADVHLALSSAQFKAALQQASAGEAANGLASDGISIRTVNAFRAGLAADMLFLVAYGLLLRKSVRFHPPHRFSRAAEWCAVATMAADAVENVGALSALGTVAVRNVNQPQWLFIVTATAAIAKWAFAAVVMLFLALRWRDRVPSFARPLRIVARAVSLAFFAGATGSILVAVSVIVPPLRPAALAALLGPALALALQFRLLDTFGRLLRFAFLARVPLIVLTAIAVFGPIGLGPGASLLGGILDVPGAWGIAATTGSCLVLAFACGTQVNMVRAYAWQRMFDSTLRVLQFRALAPVVFWTALTATGSLIFSMAVGSADVSASSVVEGVAGGLGAALVFLFGLELIAAMLTERKRGRSIPQLGVPLDRVPVLGSLLRHARRTAPPVVLVSIKQSLGQLSIAARLFGLSSGYVGADRRLLPGHSFATVQLLLSAAFYGLLVYAKWGSVSRANPWVPTAASIVLLLLLWSWALAGISFFLDRYRVPLFTSVIGLVLLSGSCKHTDHVVRLNPAPDHALASPGDILSAFPHPLVVAAAGGGIQAGAWAARALEGIDEALGRSSPAAFRGRLALVTGVSGGSMGAMFYGAYRDLDDSPGAATRRAMEPSLDEVASALIGPDLLRAFWIPVSRGRGDALERSWASRLPEGSKGVTLGAWADKSREFSLRTPGATPFPAFLFDTTIVETGQAMAFATSQFPTKAYRVAFDRAARQSPLAESANLVFDLSKGDEKRGGPVAVEVATAARLSAAFPFVSPAAALAVEGGNPTFHLVDGGYYDNYGLVVTSQWLDDALEEMARRSVPLPADLGVVIIRSLVGATHDLTMLRTPGKPEDGFVYTPKAEAHGWAWQIIAPPAAFVNGRTFGQWAGGNQVLRLLIDKWKLRGVTIGVHLFDFPAASLDPVCQIEPLSWKLTSQQKTCIEYGWNADLRSRAERLR